jgi:hypothetical protein
MKTLSWILLLIVAVLTLAGSVESAYIALSQTPREHISGGPTLADVAARQPELGLAIRARRVTAAAYAAAFAVFFLAVVWFSYRRGEVWSWWTILVVSLVLAGLMSSRTPLLGTRAGVGEALLQFGIVVVALLLDVGRLRPKASSS